jgi:hypothetical protein
MRAYTSLFGHIMGSNPAICGYYEMHIGYHSWKSLVRQKLLYFDQDEPKPGFVYMFDKVLHNEHRVSTKILNCRQAKTIFCLRHPREVIPSILKLYQSVDSSHEFNSETFATQYYVQRLATLQSLAASIDQDFFYLDAEALKRNSDECLSSLNDWLQLDTHLSSNYQLQKNSSKERYGDTSERLKTGRIAPGQSTYTEFRHDPDLLQRAEQSYHSVRKYLIDRSTRSCTLERAAV